MLVCEWYETVGNIDVSIDVLCVKMLIDVLVAVLILETIFDVVTDFGIVVLRDVSVLAAAMTALELTISPSLEATLSFSCAALTCWPIVALYGGRVLQA